jgi:hypothetical protein
MRRSVAGRETIAKVLGRSRDHLERPQGDRTGAGLLPGAQVECGLLGTDQDPGVVGGREEESLQGGREDAAVPGSCTIRCKPSQSFDPLSIA